MPQKTTSLSRTNILFYGPLWFKNKNRIGGSETGNKRTVQILTKLGFNIILLNKPYFRGGLVQSLMYPFKLIFTYLELLWQLSTKKVDSFHLSAYYFYLIYMECVFILTCKLFKVKTIYELRAGGVEMAYNKGSFLYRYIFRLAVKKSDIVLCQGTESIRFIKSITGVDSGYYPNYVMDDVFIPYSVTTRESSGIIQLVYFGRIVPSKNIEFILEICDHLQKKGVSFHMQIIGDTNGNDAYLDKLEALISKYGITGSVEISAGLPSEQLFSVLLKKHFFIFPSIEIREGHSNSLTEAMSRGVVPIVSTAGFNRSIVGDDDLVIETYDSLLYADKIENIWTSDKWTEMSLSSYEVIGRSFTESAVTQTLNDAHSMNKNYI